MQLFGQGFDSGLIQQAIGPRENVRADLHDQRVGGGGNFLADEVGHKEERGSDSESAPDGHEPTGNMPMTLQSLARYTGPAYCRHSGSGSL